MNLENIVDAIYETIWDTGAVIHGTCKVNLKTKEVFCINQPPEADLYENLQGVSVIMSNGEKHPVYFCKADNEFWETVNYGEEKNND